MPNYSETKRYIKSFAKLADGWHYGQGKPPSRIDISIMLHLTLRAALLGFEVFEAFPGIDGEIQIGIHDGENYYSITIEPDTQFTFSQEKLGEEVFYQENFSFHDVTAKLEELAFQLCDTSELSTPRISLPLTASPVILPSRSLRTAQASRASTSNVQSFAMDRSVSTSPPTTRNLLAAIQSSIGSSRTVPC